MAVPDESDATADPDVTALLVELRILARRHGVRTNGDVGDHSEDGAVAATIAALARLGDGGDGDPAQRARAAELLHLLGTRLRASGHRSEALAATEVAVSMWDELPGPSDRHAMALNDLGVLLLQDGRDAEGREAAERSVAIRRRLAERDPAVRPGLAASLQNLDTHLSAAGEREQAAAAIAEATMLYRELADIDAPTFLPRLAAALHNEGLALSEVGRPEDASSAAEEAAELYTRLAADDPGAHAGDLADTLLNLARRLADRRRWREAAEAARRSAAAFDDAGDRRGARAMRIRALGYRLRRVARG